MQSNLRVYHVGRDGVIGRAGQLELEDPFEELSNTRPRVVSFLRYSL